MSVECDVLGALLSERRRGELPEDQALALETHLAGCARCRAQARSLESLLAMVELPPVSPAELEALRTRRIAESPPPLRGPVYRTWRLPAVLVAAAAAAVLTVSVRPVPQRHPERVQVGVAESAEALPAGGTQELFPEMGAEQADESVTADDDALSLEGPGLFENIDG
jgi:anti-sigma factor RsiW